MKLSDAVIRLGSEITKYSDKFHDILAYTSVTVDEHGLVTVVTPAKHGLTSGNYITLSDLEVTRNVIEYTQDSEGIAVVEVDSDHDLTFNYHTEVKLSGADQAGYNGIFELLSVPNRRFFTIKVDPSLPDTATGTIKFHETLEIGLQSVYIITVIDLYTFTFVIENIDLLSGGFHGVITVNQRVYGVVDYERFLELYEKQVMGRYTLFITFEDANFSKDRNILSDAVGSANVNSDIRNVLIEPFSVYVLIPTTDDVFSVNAVDIANTEIKSAIYSIFTGYIFDETLSEENQYGTYPISHGMVAYSKAYYIHQYKFETYKELVLDDSIYNSKGLASPSRAFRDVYIAMVNANQQKVLDALINLDDVPITPDTPNANSLNLEDGAHLELQGGFGAKLSL